MADLIEGMAIVFSLLLIVAIVGGFVLFMWTIGRKERMLLDAVEREAASKVEKEVNV